MWQSSFQPPPHQTLKYAGYHLNILSNWWILYETSVFAFRSAILGVPAGREAPGRDENIRNVTGGGGKERVVGFLQIAVALLLFHLLYCIPAHRRGESDCIDYAWMQFWWKLVPIIAFHYVLSPLWHLAFRCRDRKVTFSEVVWFSSDSFFFPPTGLLDVAMWKNKGWASLIYPWK